MHYVTWLGLRVNGSIMIYATNGDREPKLPVREPMSLTNEYEPPSRGRYRKCR